MFERTIASLEKSVSEFLAEAQRVEASGVWIAIGGILLFIAIRIVQGMFANTILEKRFSEWLSNKTLSPGMEIKNFLISGVFSLVIILFSTIHYSFPNYMDVMKDFPTHPDIRLNSIAGVEGAFDYLVLKGERVFDAITFGIRSVLDSLELLFVKTPWIVIISAIVLLTGLSAGPKALGPADKPVNKTIALIITIHGVLTNNNSNESNTDLIPKVIASNTLSPFKTK